MNDYLVPAALVLFATTIFALIQAERQRRKAKRSEADAMGMAMQLARVARDTHAAAWSECRRHMLGLVYRIATKAEREGRDPFAALREVSQESESVVQVPTEA